MRTPQVPADRHHGLAQLARVCAVAAAGLLLLVSCSESEPDDSTSHSLATTTQHALVASGPVEQIGIVDLTVLDGIDPERPMRCAARIAEWQADSEERHFLPDLYSAALRNPSELPVEFGIDICDVLGGAGLDAGVSMVTVTSQSSSISAAIETAPFWSDLVQSEGTDGFEFHDWGWDRHLGPP